MHSCGQNVQAARRRACPVHLAAGPRRTNGDSPLPVRKLSSKKADDAQGFVRADGAEPEKPMLETARRLSFRRRLLAWRARFSIPSLLACRDERKVISLIAGINGGIAILIISVLAWLIDLPLLFPALGPSAFILFSSPFSPAAAPRSVVMGHFTAIIAGFAVWHLLTFVTGEPVSLEQGGWPVFASASLALATCCLLLVWLSCPHAPACATALIVALGAANGWSELLGMATGVLLLTVQAVTISRIAGIKMPIWISGPHSTYHS